MLASPGGAAGLRPVRVPPASLAGCVTTGTGWDADGLVWLVAGVDRSRGSNVRFIACLPGLVC